MLVSASPLGVGMRQLQAPEGILLHDPGGSSSRSTDTSACLDDQPQWNTRIVGGRQIAELLLA